VVTRVCDLQAAVSAVSGKVELVLEGEQEGAMNVARALLGKGVKAVFSQRFPDAFKPRRVRTRGAQPPAEEAESQAAAEYRPVLEWFSSGHHLELGDDLPQPEYAKALASVKGLPELAARYLEPRDADEHAVAMELVLEGLHQSSMLSRERTDTGRTGYKDMLKQMLSGLGDD
jgi:magnesium chelatase subunit I